MVETSRPLLILKFYLFWTYGAFGCIWPFLTVHMRSLGLTLEETTIINLVLPFTSLLGPPCAGALADKLGRRRLVLVLCLLLAGVCFSALLFVPPVRRHVPRSPTASLTCGPKAGIVHLEKCSHRCELPAAQYRIELRHCRVICPTSSISSLPPVASPEMDPTSNKTEKDVDLDLYKPKLCFDQRPGECHVYNASGTNESIALLLSDWSPIHSTDQECQYQLTSFSRPHRPESEKLFTGMHCQLGLAKECHVKCDLNETNKPAILQSPRCVHAEGDAFLTFWLYFLVRGIAELFPQSCLALMDAIILNMVQKHQGHYGKQILFGLTAIGIFPPIVGYLSDVFSNAPDQLDYTPAFITFDVLLLVSAVMALFLDTERTDYMPRLCKHIGKLLRNTEILVLFLVVFTLGTQFGFVEVFLYWYLQEMGASQFLLGLTLTAGVLPSLPFLFFGDVIVKKCGKANLLILALFMYSVRFTGYAFIPGPWWALIFETLEVFTLNLMWLSTATYCAKLSPRSLLATTMGLAVVLHYNAGRGVGALAGGYAMDRFGARVAYEGSAVFAGCVGLIYFAVYHFYLKDKRTPVVTDPIGNGHSPSWGHGSNGDAQAYKPMLASSK